ncbi:serine/threonine-protein kinase [Nocardia crassostreae]|uniref:serine/threonine-protein kinase n=1 Tax=Nocardia crassostreae TaxID=53428 RepID=UPI00082C7219|nr:serine/threonine-protein kinase [Nocardia crassostreae]
MPEAGEVFAGFVIERRLGTGGMGQVYLARHPRLPRLVALKLLGEEFATDAESRARFEREADLVARLDHPNIVSVYDRGMDGGRMWIAMQFVDGVDGSTLEARTMGPERAVFILGETAKALDYAHTVGVLHRDVKPANILLARPTLGHDERILLTDFGIGRLRDDTKQVTQAGTFTATLAYASPEQLSGRPLDHRADQYSLACTLFWLLCGSTPFAADNPGAIISGQLNDPPPPLATRRTGLPPALDGVLRRAMSKNPADRFATCTEFATAAERALTPTEPTMVVPSPADEPTAIVPPRPPSTAASRPPGPGFDRPPSDRWPQSNLAGANNVPPPTAPPPQRAAEPPAQRSGYPPALGSGRSPVQQSGQPHGQGPGQPPAQGSVQPPAQRFGQPPAHVRGQPSLQGSGEPPVLRTGESLDQKSGRSPEAGRGSRWVGVVTIGVLVLLVVAALIIFATG